jgi:hypothetical protein
VAASAGRRVREVHLATARLRGVHSKVGGTIDGMNWVKTKNKVSGLEGAMLANTVR